MNINNRKALLLSGGLLLISSIAIAVPARREYQLYSQPDGSEIRLLLVGDENFHTFLTDDGYPVDRDESGIFRYIGNDGNLTSFSVSEISSDSEARTRLLSGINTETSFSRRRDLMRTASPFLRDVSENTVTFNNQNRAKSLLPPSQWDNSDGHDIRKFPNFGKQKVLVILVSFADIDWTYCADPKSEMTAMLNEPGYDRYDCTGSARDYFLENSRGQFEPEFDVYGPVKLPQNAAYYGERVSQYTSDKNPARMVLDACELLDDEVDFSQYDRDGDGFVDNVYIFYAGYGENEGAESWRIWPHAWNVNNSSEPSLVLDGVQIGKYACSNEIIYKKDIMTGIGTMCHEFSHVLGLPDLYATNYSGALTPGQYTIMDQGPYNNVGRTPPLFSAYERYALEWLKPLEITGDETLTMLPLGIEGNAYKYTIDPERPTEYFLFENRSQSGFDCFIPNNGMLVWHINFDQSLWSSNTVNDSPTDQHVDLVEADGIGGDLTSAGDPFPGANSVFSLRGDGEPKFANRDGKMSELDITSIDQLADGIVNVIFGQGGNEESEFYLSAPVIRMESIGEDAITVSIVKEEEETSEQPSRVSEDDEDGDGDGDEPGEEPEVVDKFVVSVTSEWYDKDNETFECANVGENDFIVVDGTAPIRINALESGKPHTVRIYRMGGQNISAPAELTFTTSSEGIADAQPLLSYDAEAETLSWTPIENAEYYYVNVVTREPGEPKAPETADFTNKRLPTGWDYIGGFSSVAGTFGSAAPALMFAENADYLWTKKFDNDIESVTLWACVAEGTALLNIRAVSEAGDMFTVAIRRVDSEGGEIAVDNIPENVRQLVFFAKSASDDIFYLDDVCVSLKAAPVDTPVEGFVNLKAEDTSWTSFGGLVPGTEYVAYVSAVKDDNAGRKSNVVTFTASEAMGVDRVSDPSVGIILSNGELVPADPELGYDVLAADGRVIAKNVKGCFKLPAKGLYIISQSRKANKVVY